MIQSEVADFLDCSRQTVIKVLNDFRRCNLIDWDSYNGQGRGIQLVNLWLQKGKEIKNKLAWKRGHQAEAEYLKDRYNRQGQLGVNPLDCSSSIGQTRTKERNPSFAPYINNQDLSKGERRKRWLREQDGSEQASAREGFQKVIMWDLRTYLEKRNLNSEAVKATCDTFWQNVKDRTLTTAREALKELKSQATHLLDELTETIQDYYKVANRFIYFDLLGEGGESEPSATPERRKTPETFAEDKEKAERTREKGSSDLIGALLNSNEFSMETKRR